MGIDVVALTQRLVRAGSENPPGTEAATAALVYCGHLDTVPAGASGWTRHRLQRRRRGHITVSGARATVSR